MPKQLPSDILCDLGHSLWNIGDSNARLERLIKYFIFLSLENNNKNIILWLNAANNLHPNSINMLINLVKRMNDEGINLLIVFAGDCTTLHQKLSLIRFKEVGEQLPTTYTLTPIHDNLKLRKILNSCDILWTKSYFPKAYERGYRLENQDEMILKAFKEASLSISNYFKGIPYDLLVDVIYMCLYLKGTIGENRYFPNLEDWRECITYTNYQKIVLQTNSVVD